MEKIKDIRSKKTEELVTLRHDLKKEALALRFQQANGELKNTARRHQIKKTIARIETVLAEKSSEQTGVKEK